MYPVMQEDGSILIYSEETNEPEYEIPAPYMYDAEGEESFDVFYNIETTNGDYYLTVFADSNWINAEERIFPITIDPSYSSVTQVASMDTYINGDAANETRGAYTFLYVGENEKTYIYMPTPELPEGALLYGAELSVWYYYFDKVSTGYVDVTAHQVDGMTWSEGTLTWNMAENYSDTYGLSSTKLGTTLRLYGDIGAYKDTPIKAQFNIYAAVKDWIDNSDTNYGVGTNYGIGLDYVASANRSVRLYSTEGSASYRPQLEYTYAVPYSIETLEEVDLNLYYDNAYGNRFSDASDRIERAAKELQEVFLVEFNIMVNYTGAGSFYSYGDTCSASYSQACTCGECENPTISSEPKQYHHTNLYNNLYRISPPTDTSTVKVAFLGHEGCWRHSLLDACRPLPGLADQNRRVAVVSKFNTVDAETIAMIHEFGHLYGIRDHYNDGCFSTADIAEEYNDNSYASRCIYGELKGQIDSIEDIVICQGCRNRVDEYFGQ